MIDYRQYTDEELTGLLKERDRSAFNAIYARYASQLYRYAFNILKDEEECTDALQDIFVWLWVNHDKLNITCLKAYLMAAVKYKLTRVIVSSKRRTAILNQAFAKQPVMEAARMEESIEIKELKAAIHDFVNTLPQRAREIYKLSREQYLSNKEIAARLGIAEKTVENQMTITLKKLKLHLGKMSFWSIFL